VVFKDTANGDYAAVKLPPGIYEVIFTGTVTAGSPVEVLVATVKASISGSATTSVALPQMSLQPVCKIILQA